MSNRPRSFFVAQRAVRAHVGQAVIDQARVEEAHRVQVLQHCGVRLGQQGHVGSAAALLDVLEAKLITERGLAGTGSPHHQVDRAAHEAAPQQGIQARNAGFGAFDEPCVVRV
jgi:hypothetical protein